MSNASEYRRIVNTPTAPKPASYAEEREKFLTATANPGYWAFSELEALPPLDALSLAKQLYDLMLLRANEAGLARAMPAETKI